MSKISDKDMQVLLARAEREGSSAEFLSNYTVSYTTACLALDNANNAVVLSSLGRLVDLLKDVDDDQMVDLACAIFVKLTTGHYNLSEVTAYAKNLREYFYNAIKMLHNIEDCVCTERLNLDNVKNWNDMCAALCEGNIDALRILSELLDNIAGQQPIYVLQCLADMNIRGKQIVFCYDFCNHDVKALLQNIDKRDADMMRYCNIKSVRDWNSAHTTEYLTSRDGVEFDLGTDLIVNIINASLFADECTEDEVDYATCDVFPKTKPAEAIRIFEARGWIKLWECPCRTNSFADKKTQLLMLNPDTGDFFEAGLGDTISYGGASIVGLRPKESWTLDISGQRESLEQPWADWEIFTCSYQDGPLFRQYEKIPPVDMNTVPWQAYPTVGTTVLPMPEQINSNCLCGMELSIPRELIYFTQIFNNDGYTVTAGINKLLAFDYISTTVPDLYKKLFSSFLDNRYAAVMETFRPCDGYVRVTELARLCFAIAGTPESEIAKYKIAYLKILRDKLVWYKAQDKLFFKSANANIEEALGAVGLLSWVPDALDYKLANELLPWVDVQLTELPKDALDWMRAYGPEQYKQYGDFGMYAFLRNTYQKQVARKFLITN